MRRSDAGATFQIVHNRANVRSVEELRQVKMKPEYKPTLFDRHGAGATDYIRAFAFGLLVFGTCFGVIASQGALSLWTFLLSVVVGAVAGGSGLFFGQLVGSTWKRIMVDGTTTPYAEQYSYQQTLVMRGQIDEALESFEAVIAERPTVIDARLRAAELYAKERANHARAAELFREVQRADGVSSGEDIYATNRLVDLLMGPLADPGRALVELRRLIDRYPGTAAAAHARTALVALRERFHG